MDKNIKIITNTKITSLTLYSTSACNSGSFYYDQVLHDRMEAENERLHNEELAKLRSEVCDLKDNLCRQEKELSERTEKYQDEKQKNFALLFCKHK